MTTPSVCAERDFFEDVPDLGIATAGGRITRESPRGLVFVEVGEGTIVIRVEGETPGWLSYVVKSLNQIGRMERNWDLAGGEPVNPHAAAAAIRFLASFASPKAPIPDLLLAPNGNLSLEWHVWGLDLEIEVGPRGIVYAHFENSSAGEEWEGPITETYDRISKVLRQVKS